MVSVLFLGVIVMAALALLIFGGDDDSSANPPPPPTGTTATTDTTASDSVCGLPAGDQSLPAVAPSTSWELFGSMYAPTVKDVGPGIKDERQRRCYAHSPRGALLFAANYTAMANRFTDWKTMRPYLAFSSSAVEEQTRRDTAASPNNVNQSGRIVGYRITGYTDADATIELAMEASTPDGTGLGYVSFPLVWRDGDWKLYLSDAPLTSGTLTNLSGFIAWAEG